MIGESPAFNGNSASRKRLALLYLPGFGLFLANREYSTAVKPFYSSLAPLNRKVCATILRTLELAKDDFGDKRDPEKLPGAWGTQPSLGWIKLATP